MINPEKSMEEFRAASQKLGDGVGVKSLIQSMGLGMIADQLGDLKLEELLSTPPPGTDKIVAISKAIIKLDNDGSFYIKNFGKTTILANNKEVQTEASAKVIDGKSVAQQIRTEITAELISPRIPQNNKCDPSVHGVLYLLVTQPTKLGPITLPCVPNFTT
ncbi:hypothetical protein S245_017761 [Arachis hypogaea]